MVRSARTKPVPSTPRTSFHSKPPIVYFGCKNYSGSAICKQLSLPKYSLPLSLPHRGTEHLAVPYWSPLSGVVKWPSAASCRAWRSQRPALAPIAGVDVVHLPESLMHIPLRMLYWWHRRRGTGIYNSSTSLRVNSQGHKCTVKMSGLTFASKTFFSHASTREIVIYVPEVIKDKGKIWTLCTRLLKHYLLPLWHLWW